MTAASAVTSAVRAARRSSLLLWVMFIVLSTLMQLSFKVAGDKLGGLDDGLQFIDVALRMPAVWLAIAGYIAVFLVWLAILETAPLAQAFLVTALVYVPVTLGAWWLFGEAIGWGRIGGIGLIVAGVAMQGVTTGGHAKADAASSHSWGFPILVTEPAIDLAETLPESAGKFWWLVHDRHRAWWAL